MAEWEVVGQDTWEGVPKIDSEPLAKVPAPSRENFQATPENPGSMGDFSRMDSVNPDKSLARIPVDMALAFGTGGALGAVSPFVARTAPGLAKLMKYASESLMAPKSWGQAAVGGGIEGSVTEGVQNDGSLADVARSATLGAVTGAAGDKILRPFTGGGLPVNDRAQRLLDKGVDLTTMHRIGPAAGRMEDKVTGIPFVGDSLINARGREQDSFNRVMINDALDAAPVLPDRSRMGSGRHYVPDDMPVGHESLDYASSVISKNYDEILPRMSVTKDLQFQQELARITQMAGHLPPNEKAAFDNTLDQVFSPNVAEDVLLGDTFKDVFRRVRDQGNQFKASPDAFQQQLGNALGEVTKVLKDTAVRQNPVMGKKLLENDKAFAKMKVIQGATEGRGAHDNVMNTSQYLSSLIKNADSNKYFRGKAFNQEIAQDAKAVMSQKIPDSGTGPRMAMAALAGMGGAGAVIDPASTLIAAAPFMAGSAAYSKPGQRFLNSLLFENVDNAALQAAKPLSGLLAATTATELDRERR